MAKYLFVYHGGQAPAPEDQESVMAAWGKWMEDNKSALVDPGNPVGMSKTVAPSGTSDGAENAASGYTIIEAADIDAACKIAESNPMLADGGNVEVAEIMQM